MTENPFADSVVTPERIGQVALLGNVFVFAYLGNVLFEDVLFGGIAGLLVGLGTLLHLPYFMYRSAAEGGDFTGVDGEYTRRAAAGLALDAAGIIALAGQFVVDGYLVPLAVAATVAVVVYLPLQYALPPIAAETGASGA